MDSFLVRIYRRSEGDPREIAGTVEEIVTSRAGTFRTLAELGEFFKDNARINESGETPHPSKTPKAKKVEDA